MNKDQQKISDTYYSKLMKYYNALKEDPVNIEQIKFVRKLIKQKHLYTHSLITLVMKEIRISLEDKEYRTVRKKKGSKTWREYLLCGCGEENEQEVHI